ncbi:hypothetical protein A5711_13165 [Mycobacterium sp. E2238]|nr:hypothetical protein A5711_13165 [Mycobacterium sp. E2238]
MVRPQRADHHGDLVDEAVPPCVQEVAALDLQVRNGGPEHERVIAGAHTGELVQHRVGGE